MTHQKAKHDSARLVYRLLIASLTAAIMFVFFEWLFIITSPSFMNAFGFFQNLKILIIVSFGLYAILALTLTPLIPLSKIPYLHENFKIPLFAGTFLPAAILGLLSLLLVDNFTYTIFRFGIVTSRGILRLVYAALFLATLGLWWKYLIHKVIVLDHCMLQPRLQKIILTGLVVAALIPSPVIVSTLVTQQGRSFYGATAGGDLPNILFITSDGLNANSFSLYGYERDTTPFLREFAKEALVAENAFTNVGETTGSIVSIYTSKSSFRTRVIYPPDILQGSDAYQHLPGVLHALGYKTAQFCVSHYADARSQSLLEGFDEVNGETAIEFGNISQLNHFLPPDVSIFIDKLVKRAFDRLEHIFFIKVMDNPYQEVIAPPEEVLESRKVTSLIKIMDKSTQPVFIHVHLMDTHGPRFDTPKRVFSVGQDVQAQELWNVDFYDDSILSFDQILKTTINTLKKRGVLENTIIVIGTDHGKQWENRERIPLIIRFPKGAHAGFVKANTQNLDIAPTILDFLKLDKPEWMEGTSLLKIAGVQRPIFSATNYGINQIWNESGRTLVDTSILKPPYYQFGTITVIKCQKWYRINLNPEETIMITGEVKNHSMPCSAGNLLTDREAFFLIVEHLKENGFDVSLLKDFQYISRQ